MYGSSATGRTICPDLVSYMVQAHGALRHKLVSSIVQPSAEEPLDPRTPLPEVCAYIAKLTLAYVAAPKNDTQAPILELREIATSTDQQQLDDGVQSFLGGIPGVQTDTFKIRDALHTHYQLRTDHATVWLMRFIVPMISPNFVTYSFAASTVDVSPEALYYSPDPRELAIPA